VNDYFIIGSTDYESIKNLSSLRLSHTNTLDIKSVLKTLKQVRACGGTIKDSIIELQGDHKGKIKPILVGLGFKEESIDD
jgi:translation initiation factor 1 (eIF-1/SUI1)